MKKWASIVLVSSDDVDKLTFHEDDGFISYDLVE